MKNIDLLPWHIFLVMTFPFAIIMFLHVCTYNLFSGRVLTTKELVEACWNAPRYI